MTEIPTVEEFNQVSDKAAQHERQFSSLTRRLAELENDMDHASQTIAKKVFIYTCLTLYVFNQRNPSFNLKRLTKLSINLWLKQSDLQQNSSVDGISQYFISPNFKQSKLLDESSEKISKLTSDLANAESAKV